MIALLAATLAFSAAISDDDPSRDCDDVYDQTDDCASVEDTPLEGVAEAIGVSQLDFTPEVIDPDIVGMQLVFIAGSLATVALGFHATQFFYGLHFFNTREQGLLSSDEASRLTATNAVVGGLAVVAWISSILVAGSGLALFIFDPKDGSVAPIFQGGE